MTYTLTINGSALADALETAALFAGSDYTLPVLCTIQFKALEDGKLTLASTDRYMMGLTRVAAEMVTVDGTFTPFLLDAKQASALGKRLRKAGPAMLTVDTADGTVKTVTVAYGGVSESLTPVDGRFPHVDSLVPERREAGDTGPSVIGFAPAFMAKFAKVKTESKTTPMRVSLTSNTKPARVDIGDSFTGLIMPVRLETVR